MSEEEGEKLVAAVSLHYHQISIYVDEQGPKICSESLTYSISKQSSGTIILLHRSRELGSFLELVGCVHCMAAIESQISFFLSFSMQLCRKVISGFFVWCNFQFSTDEANFAPSCNFITPLAFSN